MNTYPIRRVLRQPALCAAGALLCLSAAVCSAENAGAPALRSQVVRFGDLNLSNPEGVAALYRRIEGAATRVCRDLNRPRFVWSKSEAECKRAAIAQAVAGINNEQLAALHR